MGAEAASPWMAPYEEAMKEYRVLEASVFLRTPRGALLETINAWLSPQAKFNLRLAELQSALWPAL